MICGGKALMILGTCSPATCPRDHKNACDNGKPRLLIVVHHGNLVKNVVFSIALDLKLIVKLLNQLLSVEPKRP